ncbi:MAG: chemotaxis protein CheB [Acidobacteria bacterium]|nr:chemotaxis protein CheB [Acidobacteriota bacterium]
MTHDIVVIGASAGGVKVLLDLVRELPAELPASVFVAVHTAPHSTLPDLLAARGPLPASYPVHGEKIEPGRVYVAPPDNHLLLRPGHMEVVRGPRENGHRPAVDALFRSAATAYGGRVVGVVLSGYQDCGTAGMLSIKARGGLAVVQDPDTAFAREMPASVIENLAVDHVVHPAELPPLLVHLVSTPAVTGKEPDVAIRRLEGNAPGASSGLTCPACNGPLTEAQGTFPSFRCHVGHTFSLAALRREQTEALERALWAAVRSLEESAALNRRLSTSDAGALRPRFKEKAEALANDAQLIRKILQGSAPLPPGEATKP